MASNEANAATLTKVDADGFLAINSSSSLQGTGEAAKSVRKSERIDAALNPLPTGSNSAAAITVARPRARFAAKGQSQNRGIVMADIGNYTITAFKVIARLFSLHCLIVAKRGSLCIVFELQKCYSRFDIVPTYVHFALKTWERGA